jgi:hypothetical protein
MTAPGDLVILAVLLALFVAACGYAAGRVHQRRQHGADRAEAYRDGYATGTRSVFSMAARAAGRRRERTSARAAVPPPAGDPGLFRVPSGASNVPKKEPEAASFPAPRPPAGLTVPEPAAPGGVSYSTLPDPRWTAPEERVPEQRVARPGKHTVPEELVRAATYRLPPDRVARAKVIRPEDEGPQVPRPRSS